MLIYTIEERIDLGNQVLKVFDSRIKAEEFKRQKEQEEFYAWQLKKYGRAFFDVEEYEVG